MTKTGIRTKVRKEKGLCTKCGKVPPKEGAERCEKCADYELHRLRQYRWKTRQEVILYYGNHCACCGETNVKFLTIDHIDGGGNQHKKEVKLTGSEFLRFLKRSGYPTGFQVLCWNCNCARIQFGVCPHKEV
jgi:ribosomal protein L37E